MEAELERFLGRLPKTETHLHIEGALPWELLHRMDPVRFAEPPASWDRNYRFADFGQFEEALLSMAMAWYRSPERYYEAARVVLERLWREENVRYVETSFASGVVEFLGLEAREVARAIRSAAPEGMEIRVFMGIHHDGYTERSRGFIEASLGWEEVAGLDLHGTETTPLEGWTADLWARARASGKRTKAHAGEFAGPGFVRRVLGELGVRRIQHGVQAVEDPELMKELGGMGAVLDLCPISNLKLGVVESLAAYPIRTFMEAGICCTVSTDDPVSFGNRLRDDYAALYEETGLGFEELGQLARNGFASADAANTWIAEQVAEIDAVVAELANLEQS